MDTRQFLINELNKKLSDNTDMSQHLLDVCDSFYQKPAHNLDQLKMRNKKIKGDLFEYFTQLYMKHCFGLKHVWLLSQIPDDVKSKLNLSHRDFGIDLVGVDNDDNYYAIQSKFKKRNKKKIGLTWKQLSTFYALCSRTGPYHKYVVFTTADYVSRIGKKTNKDVTINFNNIKKINHFQWIDMLNTNNNNNINNDKVAVVDLNQLREKRLKYYSFND